MQKLSFQDAAFFRMETPARPFHVGCLMVFSLPEDAGPGYVRKVVRHLATHFIAPEPLLHRKLADPDNIRSPAWVEVPDLDLGFHLRHYALPQPGRMEDLHSMLAIAHAPQMDRGMPLWELHVIEGLPQKRFALYIKIHHALVDGVTGIRLITSALDEKPWRLGRPPKAAAASAPAGDAAVEHHASLLQQLEHGVENLIAQGRALPEVASQLLHMGRNRPQDADLPQLPDG